MNHSILVPLDCSPSSEQALSIAQQIARRSGAAIHLVHVHIPFIGTYIDGFPVIDDEMDAQSSQTERAYLESIHARLTGEGQPPVTFTNLEGPVTPALTEYAAQIEAGLVVMTTHGRSGLSRLWLGSTADELVRHLAVPILLVRPQATPSEAINLPPFKRILIPLDGSALADTVLEPTIALGRLMDAEYTLLNVVNPYTAMDYLPMGYVTWYDPDSLQRQQDAAQNHLRSQATWMRAEGLRVQTRVVVGLQTAATILEEAEQQHADLIALATHGRGGLQRLLMGSVADKVLRGAHMPVLLYRPEAHPFAHIAEIKPAEELAVGR